MYHTTKKLKYLIYVIDYNMEEREDNHKSEQGNEQEKALIENINEFYRNGKESEEKGDFNTSVTLYFKALAVLADLYILREEGKIPSSHSERFRILEEKYPEICQIIDKDFLDYQNSYRIKLGQENCKILREDAEKLFRILKLNK